jgi:hypothetical protein
MAKQETQESVYDIMLLQPNNVTFGQYNISSIQENILTLISDALQKQMTREQEFPRDLFNEPYVEIFCDEAGGINNKAAVILEAKELMKKIFSFSWTHPKMNKEIETTGLIVTTIHNVKKTNKLLINFNPWAIPFLVYYGKGVGGTKFNKGLALSLRGNYTKRLYKIICSQRDRSEYFYSIDQFRKDMEITNVYSNSQIDQKILAPAKERIKESGSDVWFDYELICRHPIKGRKPKSDTIKFKINTLNPVESGGEQAQQYSFVYRWINQAMKYTNSDKALSASEKIVKSGRLKDVFERCEYYDDRVYTGQMTREHAENSLLKMLREDFKIK